MDGRERGQGVEAAGAVVGAGERGNEGGRGGEGVAHGLTDSNGQMKSLTAGAGSRREGASHGGLHEEGLQPSAAAGEREDDLLSISSSSSSSSASVPASPSTPSSRTTAPGVGVAEGVARPVAICKSTAKASKFPLGDLQAGERSLLLAQERGKGLGFGWLGIKPWDSGCQAGPTLFWPCASLCLPPSSPPFSTPSCLPPSLCVLPLPPSPLPFCPGLSDAELKETAYEVLLLALLQSG